MRNLTTKELAEKLAGGDSYIRTKNNVVKGLAIRTDLNPEAPEIIVVGNGPRIVASAELFLEQQSYVPVYIKQDTNSWRYLGDYKADSYSRNPEIIERYRRHRLFDSVDGILFLSSADMDTDEESQFAFPDSKTKKKIESLSVQHVTRYYEGLGYKIIDCQKENRGYDLLVERGDEVLKIEVKGTASQEKRFFITRNERAKSVDPLWRLVIVTNVLISPDMKIFTGSEMEETFSFNALQWLCVEQ